jgi:hypothetical protein
MLAVNLSQGQRPDAMPAQAIGLGNDGPITSLALKGRH